MGWGDYSQHDGPIYGNPNMPKKPRSEERSGKRIEELKKQMGLEGKGEKPAEMKENVPPPQPLGHHHASPVKEGPPTMPRPQKPSPPKPATPPKPLVVPPPRGRVPIALPQAQTQLNTPPPSISRPAEKPKKPTGPLPSLPPESTRPADTDTEPPKDPNLIGLELPITSSDAADKALREIKSFQQMQQHIDKLASGKTQFGDRGVISFGYSKLRRKIEKLEITDGERVSLLKHLESEYVREKLDLASYWTADRLKELNSNSGQMESTKRMIKRYLEDAKSLERQCLELDRHGEKWSDTKEFKAMKETMEGLQAKLDGTLLGKTKKMISKLKKGSGVEGSSDKPVAEQMLPAKKAYIPNMLQAGLITQKRRPAPLQKTQPASKAAEPLPDLSTLTSQDAKSMAEEIESFKHKHTRIEEMYGLKVVHVIKDSELEEKINGLLASNKISPQEHGLLLEQLKVASLINRIDLASSWDADGIKRMLPEATKTKKGYLKLIKQQLETAQKLHTDFVLLAGDPQYAKYKLFESKDFREIERVVDGLKNRQAKLEETVLDKAKKMMRKKK